MNIEKTLVIVKPEHSGLHERILADLDSFGRRIKTAFVEHVPRLVAEEHYNPHRGEFYFEWIVDQLTGKLVVLAVYEGDDVIKKIVKVAGHMDPTKAGKDTIRGRYGNESEAFAISQRRGLANVIHRSDSPLEAQRELAVWEQYLR